jgi:hypothetical protein
MGTDDLRVTPNDLMTAADGMLVGADAMVNGLTSAAADLMVAESAFGTVGVAPNLARACRDAADAAEAAAGILASVLEADTERLYHIAFVLNGQDDEGAESIVRASQKRPM